MKELEQKQKQPMQVVAEQDQRKQNFVGSYIKRPGHKVFEFNVETGAIQLAELVPVKRIDYVEVSKNHKVPQNKRLKLVMKENCHYITALNLINAKKKFGKMVLSVAKELGQKKNG